MVSMNRTRSDGHDGARPVRADRAERYRPPRSRGDIGGEFTCLLTTLHPERALSLALVQHLADEMPDIDFMLEDRASPPARVEVVWLCGYERGAQRVVRELRARYPAAVLLVTAKEPQDLWAGEVETAGADSALSWPLRRSTTSPTCS
jgi:hypothetical protein